MSNAIQTLHCQAGNHKWERETKRGRKPVNCPDHAATVVTEAKPKDKSTSSIDGVATRILEAQRARPTYSCKCDFEIPGLTWDKLREMGAGCTGASRSSGFKAGDQGGYVCSTLDAVRRAVDRVRVIS